MKEFHTWKRLNPSEGLWGTSRKKRCSFFPAFTSLLCGTRAALTTLIMFWGDKFSLRWNILNFCMYQISDLSIIFSETSQFGGPMNIWSIFATQVSTHGHLKKCDHSTAIGHTKCSIGPLGRQFKHKTNFATRSIHYFLFVFNLLRKTNRDWFYFFIDFTPTQKAL